MTPSPDRLLAHPAVRRGFGAVGALAATAALASMLGACGQGTAAPSESSGVARPSTSSSTATLGSPVSAAPATRTGPVELVGVGTVLDANGGGARLCLGGIRPSIPPQCDGIPMLGWDWARAAGEQLATGTRWGEYAVVGTFDGTTFTLTKDPVAPESYAGELPDRGLAPPDVTTPCQPPAGGWHVVDPSAIDESAVEVSAVAAQKLSGYAGLWLDQPVPEGGEPSDTPAADPARRILNVAIVGDLAPAEAVLRQVWGGPLCVTGARRTLEQLTRVQDEITARHIEWGVLTSSTSVVDNRVEVLVVHDDGHLQAELDRRYGTGTVFVASALTPVTGS
ncbi:MAG: hypothetical protein IPL45_02980 [Actinomycetales bacterium]|nr:hypothetical protein [Actinomycetales bacterium]